MRRGCLSQEERQREACSARERMVAAQADLGAAQRQVQLLAAQCGASPDLPPVSDADAQVGTRKLSVESSLFKVSLR